MDDLFSIEFLVNVMLAKTQIYDHWAVSNKSSTNMPEITSTSAYTRSNPRVDWILQEQYLVGIVALCQSLSLSEKKKVKCISGRSNSISCRAGGHFIILQDAKPPMKGRREVEPNISNGFIGNTNGQTGLVHGGIMLLEGLLKGVL